MKMSIRIFAVGSLLSSKQAYTISCLALVVFDRRCASCLRFSFASSFSHHHRSENEDTQSISWVRLDIKVVEC